MSKENAALHPLTIAIAQINPLVGDIRGNLRLVETYAEDACQQGAAIVLFPELTLLGYPPEDLLYRSAMAERIEQAVADLCVRSQDWHNLFVVVGLPIFEDSLCFNGLLVIREGAVVCHYKKQHLPNFAVFDEKRYFTAGQEKQSFVCHGLKVGLSICEDIWRCDAIFDVVESDVDVILTMNASPFYQGKQPDREAVVIKRAQESGVPLVYCNLVGGQDELVFDGGSHIALPQESTVAYRMPRFVEGLCCVTLTCDAKLSTVNVVEKSPLPQTAEEEVYQALVLATRDYVQNNGFKQVLLGLSGGIDSALTMAVAVDALGADNVTAVMMPFKYTADISKHDAAEQATAMGAHYKTIPIEPMYNAFIDALSAEFAGMEADVTEQNIQARCRGVTLMALSNKTGALVLTTGNKSEMAVGYATLYGDMAGAYCVPKDVYKEQVYALARYRNSLTPKNPPIPERVITREPSAELAPDQKDSDNLPEYAILDAILQWHIEGDLCADAIIAKGFESSVVKRVLTLVKRNEYKRNQAAPGPRVSKRAFGKDWRLPLTNGMGV